MVLVAVAGGLGAATRFVVDGAIARHNLFRVPVGTLVINVTGSLLLGLLTGWVASGHPPAAGVDVKAVLGTGFCGGYTTFSTAAVETLRLWVAEGTRTGAGYAVATFVGSVAAAVLGLWVGALV